MSDTSWLDIDEVVSLIAAGLSQQLRAVKDTELSDTDVPMHIEKVDSTGMPASLEREDGSVLG